MQLNSTLKVAFERADEFYEFFREQTEAECGLTVETAESTGLLRELQSLVSAFSGRKYLYCLCLHTDASLYLIDGELLISSALLDLLYFFLGKVLGNADVFA